MKDGEIRMDLKIDSRYIALKLIELLYEHGKINKATYNCVISTYATPSSEQTDRKEKND